MKFKRSYNNFLLLRVKYAGLRQFICCPLLFSLTAILSCSVSNQISKQAARLLLKDSSIIAGHAGVSIYEPATGRYWYNYDAEKYFVPASNVKLFTLYAGMKYLKDSIPALRYAIGKDSNLLVQPAGDPTFLNKAFSLQQAFDFLKHFKKITFTSLSFADNFFGSGWAWDDYTEPYMTQRSSFPLYANLITIKKSGDKIVVIPPTQQYILPERTDLKNGFNVLKKIDDNIITLISGTNESLSVPFTPKPADLINMLQDTLHAAISIRGDSIRFKNVLFSQPTDSLFKPMMYTSNNFFAEQTLLMVSNELLGYMNDEKIIDTILNNELKDVPQQPKWVDGSGLSRYNLFTPQSFVYILNKMKMEFGLERLKHILPTGGEGTLASYYQKDAGFIFAKTGTLSNHCALSGLIITRKNKLLIFSILVNHYPKNTTPVRRAVEKFLTGIREKY